MTSFAVGCGTPCPGGVTVCRVGDRTEPWTCPVCGSPGSRPAFRSAPTVVDEVRPEELKPASAAFGTTLDVVVRCETCRHGSLRTRPAPERLAAVYAHVEDRSSLDEEEGQRATARRDLAIVRQHVEGPPARLLDVGCWTGALLSTAADLGWRVEGIEPSGWAASVAAAHGHEVRVGSLEHIELEDGAYQVIACCDVLEHLVDPAEAARRLAGALAPGGVLFATVPDAGSLVARALGRRWWSVLPMHVQYFTRSSLRSLLRGAGLEVLAMRTHPKVFTRRYYADRVAELVPPARGPVAALTRRGGWADRPVAPDLRDRVAVVARRPAGVGS